MKILDIIKTKEPLGVIGSPSSSFEVILDIRDINEESKLLGELVCFPVKEGKNTVFVLGQVTEIETKNRWHEEPSFKGIIKRHGKLPNLSGIADNRIAILDVQSSFLLKDNEEIHPHKLANSPSTGVQAIRADNEIMKEILREHESLVTMGYAYDTDVKIPFWFKHFGKSDTGGAGDAYHIGVFGRTGSGKTTTAANMILGYARNKEQMSILILDPQEQFHKDNNVLPGDVKFEDKIKQIGMKFKKYKIPEEVALTNDAKIFSQILLNKDFIKYAFNILTPEKTEEMAEAIERYIETRIQEGGMKISKERELGSQLLNYFLEEKNLKKVYATKNKREDVQQSIKEVLERKNHRARSIFQTVASFFSEENKIPLKDIVDKIVLEKGNVIVLNISGRGTERGMDDIETLYVKLIEDAIKEKGAELYSQGKQANCLVVLDEAHRFINTYSFNDKIKALSTSIIDAVRTTRKYGIGYMFITQTIESLHEEIRRQIRIFAFGYGLTSGSEFVKIKDIINDDSGAKFYRSFIDPSSNNKFPFMFYGPISPLSFTGAPLFLEMDGELKKYPEEKTEKE